MNKNDSIDVGFDLTVIDSGVQASNCSLADQVCPFLLVFVVFSVSACVVLEVTCVDSGTRYI